MKTSESHQVLAALQPATRGAGKPHPAVLILLWIFLAVVSQLLHPIQLLFVGMPLLFLAARWSSLRLLLLLRRTRWIMLSLALVYAYVTPGELIWPQMDTFSPTQEGLTDGMLQLCRIVIALAGLSIILSLLQPQQLISGIYSLAYPLRFMGLSRERVAVRLALTLHYAELAMHDTTADWRGSVERMLAPVAIEQATVEMSMIPFSRRDGLLLAAAIVVLAAVLI